MEAYVNRLLEEIKCSTSQIQIPEGTGNCEKDIIRVISLCVQSLFEDSRYNDKWFMLIDSVIDRLWEKLNTGKWQDVFESHRHLYAFASYIKTGIILRRVNDQCDSSKISNTLTDAIKAADMGLLMGSSMRKELSHVANELCRLIHSVSDYQDCPETSSFPKADNTEVELRGEAIPVVVCPSIESFSKNYFNPRKPVKLKGCIEHWPALQRWSNVKYILEKIGPRTVPVEIGSSYTSSEWSQKLMTVRSFIETYMLKNNTPVGYIAQHQLFNQIVELLDDIREPEYCCLSDTYEKSGDGVDVNAWFGPAHTVSPMHYDPKHNLLTQIVGSKAILLADPKYNDDIYPYEDALLFNTSQVNPEKPDFDQFPKFKDVPLMQCVLEPGDMLYIPPKWWHHVRSLSASFSVSFWWN